jgi:ribosomal protein S7
LLINEVLIDVSRKTPAQVLEEALKIINETQSLTEYQYIKPARDLFYSWVHSNGLR